MFNNDGTATTNRKSTAVCFLLLLVHLIVFPRGASSFLVGSPTRTIGSSPLSAAQKGDSAQLRKKGAKKKKPKRRPLSSGNSNSKAEQPRRPAATAPRPRLLVHDCEVDPDPDTNRERLHRQEIGCEHFDQCSGCSVSGRVGRVDIVRAARHYFASTAVRRKRLDVLQQGGSEFDDDDDGDNFYRVVVPTKVTGWRTQAKLAVVPRSGTSAWSKDGGCAFGLYERGTHDVLQIPNCAVHHPSINEAVRELERATAKVRTSAFSKDSRDGRLRYVQLQVERTTGKICLTLVWNAASIKDAQPALARLVKELTRGSSGNGSDKEQQKQRLWHSIWVHCNDGMGNNIFSRNAKRWYRLVGPEFVREPLPTVGGGSGDERGSGGWLYFSPLTFRQGNLDGFGVLATDVAQAIPGGSRVCELYGGVGVLSLTALAHHAREEDQGGSGDPLVWVRCSDENPANPRCFQRAVDTLPSRVTGRGYDEGSRRKGGTGDVVVEDDDDDEEEGMTLAELAALMNSGGQRLPKQERRRGGGDKTSYIVASAGAALRSGQALGADVLIVDPPRKGLEDEVLAELCKPYSPDQPYAESTALLTVPDERVNWTNDVRTLVYVSCGFAALARETEALLSGPGGWYLKSATGYVLFPGTDHVESVCVFERK